jgi:hypothetical protein
MLAMRVMKRIALAIGLAGLAIVGGAQAQNQVPRTAVCTADNSERTSVATVAANPSAWMGRCVAMEGLYSGERVHEDVDAIYGVTDHAVGGFVDGLGARTGALRGLFVGRVSDCATAEEILLTAQLRAPGISLHERVLGCPTGEGPFLMFMSHGELEPSGLKRRLPGARGGDLVKAGEDWAHYRDVVAMAQMFETAMQSSDAEMLSDVVRPYEAERLLVGNGSALVKLKERSERGFAVFRDVDDTSAERFAGEACWCLTRDCADTWPIHSRDADNQPSRPYACLRVEGKVPAGGIVKLRIDPSHEVSGLEEP